MRSYKMSQSQFRLAAVALGVSLALSAGGVYAQQSAGSVSVSAPQGASVLIDNKALGISRTVKIGAGGAAQVSQLPPGTYTVTLTSAGGKTETRVVVVAAGEDVLASFETLQRVVVSSKALDVKTTESAQTLTKEAIDRIPVGKNVTSIALLAPGATQGDSRIGETGSRSGFLPSLGGASPAENAYYINGFNVTNIFKGVAYNQVPFEAVADISVKTGGYGAEYGRSLGGVITVNTKRGTNEWHGGISASVSPDLWQGSSIYTKKNATTGAWDVLSRPGGSSSSTLNLWGSGPIIQDKLYFFGLVQGGNFKANGYGVDLQTQTNNNSPMYLTKFDWNLNKDNRLEFTSFSDKNKDIVKTWKQTSEYGTARGDLLGTDKFNYGGTNNILKYTSWVNDDFNISALYGVGKFDRSQTVENSATCPIVIDVRSSPTRYPGCYTDPFDTSPGIGDTRAAFRLDLEYNLGKHKLRAGLDNEKYTTVDGQRYSGGIYHRILNLAAGASVLDYTNNTGATQTLVRDRYYENGGTFVTKNSAWYVEDSFQVNKEILLSVGLRNEQFQNLNASGEAFVEVKNTWAPRLAATWDIGGKQTTKAYANYGRYYIPVYANTNARLSGAETFWEEYYAFTGDGAAPYGIPGKGALLTSRNVISSGEIPDARTVVDTNLQPLYQDELILGFQKALSKNWTYGVKYTHRDLKAGMDDICAYNKFNEWALANGYSASQADAIASATDHCFLTNPGKTLTANVDLDGTGTLTPVKIPTLELGFPVPTRKYDAIELQIERAWDRQWSLGGSYVYSLSRGNTEGYVKSDIGQDDAGLTQDFDKAGLMEGSSGYLPNDRRHSVKLWGSYGLTNEWRVGGSLFMQSGRPINCIGYYAGTADPEAADYGAASFYCGGKLAPRGSAGRTPWTQQVNLQAAYSPSAYKGLTFTFDLFNLLNKRTVRSVNETGEDGLNSASPSFMQPLSFTPPRSVKLTASYQF